MTNEVINVLLISLMTDLDNIVIYLFILKRKPTFTIIILLVSLLALKRTIYISFVHQLTEIQGMDILVGLIILFIAYKMTTKKIGFSLEREPKQSIIKVMATILLLDFFMAMDGVLLISSTSLTYIPIFFGIALSLLILFIFSPIVFRLIHYFPWFYIIVGSFIGYTAVTNMTKDKLVYHWFAYLNQIVPTFDISKVLSIISALLLLGTGLFISYKNNRIVRVR